MDFINPYWHVAAAMALYLNTLDFLGRLQKGRPTNGNALVGSLLTGYLALSFIALGAR